jgi:hypothetical protein
MCFSRSEKIIMTEQLSKQLIRLVFENRVLRRIFGPKRDEVTGDRREMR